MRRFTTMMVSCLALALLLAAAPSADAGFGFRPGSVDATATNEDGTTVTQAGSHPFQVTTEFEIERAEQDLRDVSAAVPPGLVGSATAVPQCSQEVFDTPVNIIPNASADCPVPSQIGVARISTGETLHFSEPTFATPIYNLTPVRGLPAEFAFDIAGQLIFLRPRLRSDGDYGFTVQSINTSQLTEINAVRVTLWGVPASSGHDPLRWPCLGMLGESLGNCPSSVEAQPFLTMPTSCTGPSTTTLSMDSWQNSAPYLPDGEPDLADPNWAREEIVSHDSNGNPIGLEGCEKLPFVPRIAAAPTTDRASAPTGLDFEVNTENPGLTNPGGLAASDIKKVITTLPLGFTANPSVAAGLGACSEAQFHSETLESEPGAGCPNDSNFGTVSAESPLLDHPVKGNIYIAAQNANPFGSLLALYLVFRDPESGIFVRLAGKVEPNPVTGQLVTTFDDLPQLPISHFDLSFRQGQRAPLISPPTCGTFTATSDLYPWSNPTVPVHTESSFTITKNFEGGTCPSGTPPFDPNVTAGAVNPQAGSYSPFEIGLTRTDGEQEITGFSTKLPPGETANLTGVPFCGEADIALARTKTGAAEEANSSCPESSLIGHTSVGAGVGAVLVYTPGKLYMGGPFEGSPFSIVSITSAKVGPFDLGTVVVHLPLNIDPETATVSVPQGAADQIPHIIQGIVIHVRDIQVSIDRTNFTLNPTDCTPKSFPATIFGSGADFQSAADDVPALLTNPFQVANCAALGFKPKFSVSTSAQTSKANGASLDVKLSYPAGSLGSQANIRSVKVELPKQLPSRLTTLQKACTAVQFDANPAGCPAASVIGHARAVTPILPVPIEGPAYFVSHGGEAFPSLILVLQGYGVRIDLVGTTFISKAGITSSTFKTVPDQPVTSFELTLPTGPFSALTSNLPVSAKGSFCGQNLTMPTELVAQNGIVIHQSTIITPTGCPRAKIKTRAQKLAIALKACNKQPKGVKRSRCKALARKHYGPLPKTKKGRASAKKGRR